MDIIPLTKTNSINYFEVEDTSQNLCLICHEALSDREIENETQSKNQEDNKNNYKNSIDTSTPLEDIINKKMALLNAKLKKEEFINEVTTLKCGHKFHYNCILNAYKINREKHNSSKNIRCCPYCRGDGGYLELKKNIFPLKKIHKEYIKIAECVLLNDYKKVEELTKNYLNTDKCYGIVQTGSNKGSQCNKSKAKGCNYCFIHKKKYDIK